MNRPPEPVPLHVHFMRRPGAGPDPVPLILSHGWPWTFWHWSKVVDVWHELMTGVLGHERYAAAGCDVERVFSKDDLLTHATIYWAGESIASSIRTYANNNRYPWTPSHGRWPVVEAPTGITFVGYENPPGVTTGEQRIRQFLESDRAAWYNHAGVTCHDRGGHFIPWEIPQEWVSDLRRTFRGRR
jgi:hypothetical protein